MRNHLRISGSLHPFLSRQASRQCKEVAREAIADARNPPLCRVERHGINQAGHLGREVLPCLRLDDAPTRPEAIRALVRKALKR